MNYLKAFGRFWYDFIVGDSAVLAIGTVASLAVAALLVRNGMNLNGFAAIGLPVLVVITLGISLRTPG